MHIVLVEPEIPQNAGNIARTCALTRSTLHLIKPLGFSLEDRYLKRAGLDYWDKVEVKVWESFEEWVQNMPDAELYLATTRTDCCYHERAYSINSCFVFGSESRGLPGEMLDKYHDRLIRIPMLDIGRSLNLSNSVAIITYEALRQNNYQNLA
ncbi:MAG: tRNA (cytidine(34)-2'-O)-methyltransferase [Syntrophomonadaceae bacterium]